MWLCLGRSKVKARLKTENIAQGKLIKRNLFCETFTPSLLRLLLRGMFLGLIPRDRLNYAAIKMEKCPSRTIATIFLRMFFSDCWVEGSGTAKKWKLPGLPDAGKLVKFSPFLVHLLSIVDIRLPSLLDTTHFPFIFMFTITQHNYQKRTREPEFFMKMKKKISFKWKQIRSVGVCYFCMAVMLFFFFPCYVFADKMPVEKRDSIISDKKISPNGQGLYFPLPKSAKDAREPPPPSILCSGFFSKRRGQGGGINPDVKMDFLVPFDFSHPSTFSCSTLDLRKRKTEKLFTSCQSILLFFHLHERNLQCLFFLKFFFCDQREPSDEGKVMFILWSSRR